MDADEGDALSPGLCHAIESEVRGGPPDERLQAPTTRAHAGSRFSGKALTYGFGFCKFRTIGRIISNAFSFFVGTTLAV